MKQPSGGVYSELCRGRRPFAVAELHGGARCPSVQGRVSFYATPAGVLVSAKLSGLPGRAGSGQGAAVFGVCLESEEEVTCGGCPRLCTVLPPLYERNGCAWYTVVTGRLAPSDLTGRRVILRERTARCAEGCGREIAAGRAVSPA